MKFIEMAKTHDGSTADMLGRDFKSEGQANDTYAMIDADARVFPFGKVHDLPLGKIAMIFRSEYFHFNQPRSDC